MSPAHDEPLRIALVYHTYGQPPGPGIERTVYDYAVALREAGQRPCVISSHRAPTKRSVEDGVPVVRSRRLSEALLQHRGFAGPLTHLPLNLRAVAIGGYDVAQSFSPPDALVLGAWRRLSGTPTIFTCAEVLGRHGLANRRLQTRLLRHATYRSDMVTATTHDGREALWRWLAVDAPVIAPADAEANVRLYRALIGRETSVSPSSAWWPSRVRD